ncbi:hypothetical protein [Maridesulfovibrio hydrothermalis]|uniref:FlgN protein n=1 Tax=Maridesulfovibrio hydrothermalis AM13 = DSM 14728 TaxID=1121451 RepID=L0RCE2_9BACT|nr:hypothetical protein [Maridesulfovibrio hydrothermalis]CCO23892.1 conserved protein of unknown function [Maridesulfovibrio hydrothermalis AM13 = DSM 14728]
MAETLNLLDQALDIGHEELQYLVAGEVDEASDAAERRGFLTTKALETKESVSLDQILDKLNKLKNLQGQLTSEAKKLHASLKSDIGRVKKENVRFKGYGSVVRGASLMPNRYINKVG